MNTIDKYLAQAAKPLSVIGYYVSYFGLFLILIWIGIFKFTPTEAEAIRPLVENHPMMSWMYEVFSVQTVSNLFGTVEIITAILLLVGLKFDRARLVGGIFVIATFIFTISFLFTTPDVWKTVDGVIITNFSILKDIPMLGLGGIIMLGHSKK